MGFLVTVFVQHFPDTVQNLVRYSEYRPVLCDSNLREFYSLAIIFTSYVKNRLVIRCVVCKALMVIGIGKWY